MRPYSVSHQLSPSSEALEGRKVLVVGNRPPISKTLSRLKIPFAVWHDKAIKNPPACLGVWCAPFPSTSKGIRAFIEATFRSAGSFTHVIAGTEAGVYVASVCRRALGARKSKDSIALLCHDKQHMKQLMQANGVPMTPFLTVSEAGSFEAIFERLGPKVVVKHRRSSGGRGITIAESIEQVAERRERGLIYEKHVEANELSVETYVRDSQICFTSTTNYLVKSHANIVPANIPREIVNTALALNRIVIDSLNLAWGLTHAEFYWTEDQQVLFGEVALRPPGGYIMDCISLAREMDAWEAFVANELDLPFAFPSGASKTAGCAMLHCGSGQVKAIRNSEMVSKLPECVRFRVLDKPGQWVGKRESVSEVSAYALFVSDDSELTTHRVLQCLNEVQFDIE